MTRAAKEIYSPLATMEDAQKDLYLTFHLGDEDFAIDITQVTEIVGIPLITTIPDHPNHIKGVINLRGSIIPVMDVRLRFGMPERGYDERTCLIVVKGDDSMTGLVVDRVNEVVEIPTSQIEPAPLKGGRQNYIHGLGKLGDSVKILLNLKNLLDEDEELEIHQDLAV
ncbi:CheW protein [Malonomonas rubra DSM 5091]|uniref:CheW protein n=1 Tax=Malonomonas rubra DSM 5091 TaxID=1122189 RepID=A0A1M6IMB4_MALRU|nr:chemotaxis protein CheW [Malonomonas rubra]SHJ35621.1 CheW protein [Malonomonas rubra DSM 5091]